MSEIFQTIVIDSLQNKSKLEHYYAHQDERLVGCSIEQSSEETENEIKLIFETENLTSLSDVSSLNEEDKFRVLINTAKIKDLSSRYVIDLSPDNLYFDGNLNVKMLRRTIGVTTDSNFDEMYSAITASILNPKYTYPDFLNGGKDLLTKNQSTAFLSDGITSNEIVKILEDKYVENKESKRENFQLISRKKYKALKTSLPIILVLLLVVLAYSLYSFIYLIPLKDKIIKANACFQSTDYMGTISALEDVSLDSIPYETKYILAISYLKSVDLSQSEKSSELLQLTTNTQEILFDYWIHIGRLDYVSAIDDAQRLNSDSHLFYAYVCYKNAVETDLEMSGEEKSSLLNELNSEIDTLAKELRGEET